MDGGQVALLKGGKLAAYTWMTNVNGERRVFAAVAEVGKSPTGEEPIEGSGQTQPEVIALSDGKALVAFEQGARIKYCVLDEKGKAGDVREASAAPGDQHYPDLCQLPDGSVLVAFEAAERGKTRVIVAPIAVANGGGGEGK